MNVEVVVKHAKLVNHLYDKTIARQLQWDMGSYFSNVEAVVGNYKINLSEGTDDNGSPVEILNIKDEMNREIETFNDNELRGLTPPGGEFETYWKKMERLRQVAYRQAIGAEDALDSILSFLENDEDTPF